MSNDRVLKEQLELIEERHNKRLNTTVSGERSEKAGAAMKRQLVICLVFLSLSILAGLILVGFLGRVWVLPAFLLLCLAGYFIFNLFKKSSEEIIKEEGVEKKKIYEEIEDDLQKVIEISNDAISTKNNFLSGISHDIRSPINAILGLNEMVIRESREATIRGYAQDIKSAGNTLMSFVTDVLDTSRIEEGRLEIVAIKYDLSSVVNDIMNMNIRAANEKGLKLTVKVDEKTPHLLKGDEVRIKQCILKLMSNAIKFTDEGNITVEIGYAKLTDSEILLTASVSDTGRGIKEEDLERLFVPFEKASADRNIKNEGSGLGMTITRKLLEMMGSELRVESKFGSGSTFKFSLKQEVLDWQPIGNVDEAYARLRDSQGRYEESFRAPDAKVLVVDDSPVNLMIAEGLLKETKMQITLAESGQKAVNACKETKFDLILLDHMMPEMDGIETLHHIREDEESINKKAPIVALTANAVDGAKELYEKEGFDFYLSKPIVAEKLEEAIKSYLDPKLVITGGWEKEAPPEDLKDGEEASGSSSNSENPFLKKMEQISGIFVDKGIEYSGSPELYEKVVTEFTDTGNSRADIIEGYFEAQDIKNYTIQVHALKSAARIIGATALSQLAAALEEAGNAEDMVRITNATGELLKRYRGLVSELEAMFEDNEEKPEIDEDSLKDAVASLKEVVEAFDFDSVDSIMDELKKYKMPDAFKEKYAKLKTLVAEVARDDILLLLGSI